MRKICWKWSSAAIDTNTSHTVVLVCTCNYQLYGQIWWNVLICRKLRHDCECLFCGRLAAANDLKPCVAVWYLPWIHSANYQTSPGHSLTAVPLNSMLLVLLFNSPHCLFLFLGGVATYELIILQACHNKIIITIVECDTWETSLIHYCLRYYYLLRSSSL